MLMSYGLSFDASMTSNDFAANLYDIVVTFVTEAYGFLVV